MGGLDQRRVGQLPGGPQSGGEKLYENFYGSKEGNNAGEWLSYDTQTGDIMVFTDSDTAPGFGFLKLSPGNVY